MPSGMALTALAIGLAVSLAMLLIARPLLFATLDEAVAAARESRSKRWASRSWPWSARPPPRPPRPSARCCYSAWSPLRPVPPWP
jgi:hypothetical protein